MDGKTGGCNAMTELGGLQLYYGTVACEYFMLLLCWYVQRKLVTHYTRKVVSPEKTKPITCIMWLLLDLPSS